MSHSNRQTRNIIENLENRVLLAQIHVNDFGAVPNDGRDDFAAIDAAFKAAKEGDTIVFGKGTYDVGKHLHWRSHRTYRGSGELETRLKFNNDRYWGSKVWPDSSHVTVENFVFDGGGLAMAEGRASHITIKNNEFVNTPKNVFNGNGPAIFIGVANENVTISGNYIHGHDKYGMIIYSSDKLTVKNNTLKNLHQGMHILNPGKDINVSYNLLTGMVRMGIEMQRHGSRTAENVLVEGNVLMDWRRPYHDSFALSIVPDGSSNVRVMNNYIRGVPRGWNGEWGHQTSGKEGKRMGYGIEYGSKNGVISGNVIGGAFANYVCISGAGGLHNEIIPIRDNKFYGVPSWTDWIFRGSPGGSGFGYSDQNNLKDTNHGNMPSAPKNAGAGFESKNNSGSSNSGGSSNNSGGSSNNSGSSSNSDFAWVSDLKWERARNGWGPVEINRSNGEQGSNDGNTLSIDGQKYDKGLGVHSDSEIVYRIDGKYKSFTSRIGLDDEVGRNGSVVFQLWADGKKIYDSGLIRGSDSGKNVDADVRGVNELKLIVTGGGDNIHWDHADWANAKLLKA